ncbi:putative quinol monooxygenase [Maritalea porphyrae]|uniref:Antibiotic biosynthesis monooxygenase n=1 Tax=Maritalea porphyrae TaxID=880732 RepID=A0ABQ5UR20_9HYPH|nr:putative quinol monooxygenase [Maritalea porphyrae]GLQ17334.1 antibiotic biosynthesis monooxygenase [Maritalea porphyrae]
MFAVVVRFKIKPENWGAFMPLMRQNANASVSLEPLCKQFDVLTDPSRPNEVLLYEIYDSPEAFGDHLKSAHFIAFDRQVSDMIETKHVETFSQVS